MNQNSRQLFFLSHFLWKNSYGRIIWRNIWMDDVVCVFMPVFKCGQIKAAGKGLSSLPFFHLGFSREHWKGFIEQRKEKGKSTGEGVAITNLLGNVHGCISQWFLLLMFGWLKFLSRSCSPSLLPLLQPDLLLTWTILMLHRTSVMLHLLFWIRVTLFSVCLAQLGRHPHIFSDVFILHKGILTFSYNGDYLWGLQHLIISSDLLPLLLPCFGTS